MSDELAYVTRAGAWLARSISGSEELFLDFFTDELGAALPDAVRQAPAVRGALQHAATAAADFKDVASALESPSGDESSTVIALVNLGIKLAAYFVAVGELSDAVTAAITPATVPNAAERTAAQNFAANLAE